VPEHAKREAIKCGDHGCSGSSMGVLREVQGAWGIVVTDLPARRLPPVTPCDRYPGFPWVRIALSRGKKQLEWMWGGPRGLTSPTVTFSIFAHIPRGPERGACIDAGEATKAGLQWCPWPCVALASRGMFSLGTGASSATG
jgi:hypothetical protein